jgi:hypothetical protein
MSVGIEEVKKKKEEVIGFATATLPRSMKRKALSAWLWRKSAGESCLPF